MDINQKLEILKIALEIEKNNHLNINDVLLTFEKLKTKLRE